MSAERGFLSRWSQRKRGTAPEQEPPAQPRDEAVSAGEAAPALPEGKSLEELVAALPKLEDLVPGQNLSAFMQGWVPADLRNAALRQMWRLDPAISGYVDPALDYAYDYNLPGGAPGFGPLETSAEAVREVAEMFERAIAGKPALEDTAVAEALPEPESLPDSAPEAAPETASPVRPIAAAPIAEVEPEPEPARTVPVRRHGRALPG